MNSPLEKSIFTCCGGLWEYFVQGGLTTSIRKQELRSRISTHRTGWNKLFRLSSIRSHLLSRVISIIGHPLLKCGWILFSTWTPYQVGNFIYKTIMRRFLQALLVEQGLTVCWLCVCVCICVRWFLGLWLVENWQRCPASYDVAILGGHWGGWAWRRQHIDKKNKY